MQPERGIATMTTAACGRNRESLLGPWPARRERRPRREADAGSHNPAGRPPAGGKKEPGGLFFSVRGPIFRNVYRGCCALFDPNGNQSKNSPACTIRQAGVRYARKQMMSFYGLWPMPPSSVRVSPDIYLKSGMASWTQTRPISVSALP